ncbi:hypothetical protein Ddc_18199 [Ditylenchus destructor]|nr:hypothetical protein Ddc_18199 [Ditylenchus destructor]
MECSGSVCTYKLSMFALPNEQYKVGAKREGKDVRRRKAISTRRRLPNHFPEEPFRIEVDFDYNLIGKKAFINSWVDIGYKSPLTLGCNQVPSAPGGAFSLVVPGFVSETRGLRPLEALFFGGAWTPKI